MTIGIFHYLILAGLLFCIGLFGVLSRRNAILILMSIELMLQAVNINLVAFAKFIHPQILEGQVFAIFVIVVAAVEVAVGLAIILSIYRLKETIFIDEINLMKW
jgi:NADH-quinone oxidoreductase subunit K